MGIVLIALLALLGPLPAYAANPMDTVHAFCRADGRGERIVVRTWPTIAPLVEWGLEPAWDHVILIHGFEVGSARYDADGNAFVSVTFHVAAEVEAGKVTKEPREEKRTFRVVSDEARTLWVIAGPPPVPHVFISQVEPDEMAASLDADTGSFITNTAFIQSFLNGAGWELSPFRVRDAPELTELNDADDPQAGDIVLYYDGDTPYHIGVLESDGVVLSATHNVGIRRAPIDAFAGKVRYRRARASARVTTPTPVKEPTKKKAPAKRKRKG
jgi:hypothetical protein